jgi:hypothetical protein
MALTCLVAHPSLFDPHRLMQFVGAVELQRQVYLGVARDRSMGGAVMLES